MAEGRRTLVVDDNEINRRIAVAFMKRLGWDVREAVDGADALGVLADGGTCNLVLLDVSMPGMSGLEVCRRIRSDPALAGLAVLAYTAHALAEERTAMLEAGFDDVLVKPVKFEALAAALKARGFP
ncbi:MAG TPA: response regulator [Rhodocyclaceae bacterium]|nr:response regulator [Rhodocyclaceae bacterium]HNH36144.1 response regulator [Rhodocyclaceae bacterium]